MFAILAASDPVSNKVIQSPLMTRKEERDEREREGEGGIRVLRSRSSCQIVSNISRPLVSYALR